MTICYEYIELIHQRAPKVTTPDGVTYEDAIVAGVVLYFKYAHLLSPLMG